MNTKLLYELPRSPTYCLCKFEDRIRRATALTFNWQCGSPLQLEYQFVDTLYFSRTGARNEIFLEAGPGIGTLVAVTTSPLFRNMSVNERSQDIFGKYVHFQVKVAIEQYYDVVCRQVTVYNLAEQPTKLASFPLSD